MTEPEAGDWPVVHEVVHARRRELKMSTAELARQTCLSQTTIRYIGTSVRNKSGLVAISAVLRWRYDHLTNILNGQPDQTSTSGHPRWRTLSASCTKKSTRSGSS